MRNSEEWAHDVDERNSKYSPDLAAFPQELVRISLEILAENSRNPEGRGNLLLVGDERRHVVDLVPAQHLARLEEGELHHDRHGHERSPEPTWSLRAAERSSSAL